MIIEEQKIEKFLEEVFSGTPIPGGGGGGSDRSDGGWFGRKGL